MEEVRGREGKERRECEMTYKEKRKGKENEGRNPRRKRRKEV